MIRKVDSPEVSVWSLIIRGTACVLSLISEPMLADTANGNAPHGRVTTATSHCPRYAETDFARVTETVEADPSNWIEQIVNAPAGSEVLLADGLYKLDSYAVVFERPLTVRSASGNRDAVIIEGQGYGINSEALMVMADDVHIADLTVKNVRDHAISIKEGFARSVIYNVQLIDVGTQHIKGNRMGPDGVIACSTMGYSTDVAPGDYNGAVDLHGAVGWTIRDNTIYNIWGDGSGCLVDEECGTYYPGGGPAILLWKDSKDNVVERNRITGSFRGISLGLDTPYTGGIVRDNFIYLDVTGKAGVNGFIEHDTGISLLGANNVTVEGNTVLLPGDYPGPIELQNAEGIEVRNNLVSAPVWNRGDSQYNGCDIRTNNDCDDLQYGNVVIASSVAGLNGQVTAESVIDDTDAAGEDSVAVNENDIVESADESDASNLPLQSASIVEAEVANARARKQVFSAVEASTEKIETSIRVLIQDLSGLVEQARMERIRGVEERLKMKEERLFMMEMMLNSRGSSSSASLLDDLALRKRLRNIEALLMQLEE